MKISVKSLSVYKITFISYITLAIVIVLLMALLVYTSAYPLLTELTDKGLMSETNYVNQSIESTVNKTLFSCELLSKNEDFIEMIKNFTAANPYDQFYLGQALEGYMSDYWTTDLAVANSYLILPGSKYSPQRGNFAYIESYENMIQVDWFKSVSDLSAAMVMQFNMDMNSLDSTHNSIPKFITALTQIYDSDNNPLGYLVINFSARHFESNFYNSSHIVKEAYVYTVDNQGKIVYSNTDIPIGDFFDYKSAISTNSAKCVSAGDYSVICSKTNKQGWKTIQITPSAPLYQRINSVKYITIIMIILTLILGFLLSIVLSKITTVPIMRLADNMKLFVKSGKLKKLSNTYENEIGVIINTYNNMIDRIEQLMAEQKQHMHLRKQAELKMLQAQINPHFLYNTLDSISWRAIRSNVPEVGKLLSKLARLYQHSLYKGLDVHPLGQELEQIELYMTLQQECFNSEFIYDIAVDDELLGLYIPRFILQPIIENTIIHGFGGTKAKGIITISAKTEENKLVINISDNGKGIDFDIMNRINTNGYKSERYGIINIKERISLICGDDFGITFSNNEPLGTTVIYKLPICNDFDFFERR